MIWLKHAAPVTNASEQYSIRSSWIASLRNRINPMQRDVAPVSNTPAKMPITACIDIYDPLPTSSSLFPQNSRSSRLIPGNINIYGIAWNSIHVNQQRIAAGAKSGHEHGYLIQTDRARAESRAGNF